MRNLKETTSCSTCVHMCTHVHTHTDKGRLILSYKYNVSTQRCLSAECAAVGGGGGGMVWCGPYLDHDLDQGRDEPHVNDCLDLSWLTSRDVGDSPRSLLQGGREEGREGEGREGEGREGVEVNLH